MKSPQLQSKKNYAPFKNKKFGEYMKYDINLLSQKYVEYLEDHEIYQEAPTKTNFQIDAYNDLEYLDCVKVIQENFENVDDLCLYEKFLKGE